MGEGLKFLAEKPEDPDVREGWNVARNARDAGMGGDGRGWLGSWRELYKDGPVICVFVVVVPLLSAPTRLFDVVDLGPPVLGAAYF